MLRNKVLINTVIAFAIAMFVSGCTGGVYSNITTFHKLKDMNKKKVTLYTMEKYKDQDNNLEYDNYRSKVESYLKKSNFHYDSNANIVIKFYYGIDSGSEQIISTPIVAQTGVSSSYTSGRINTYGKNSTYSANTTYTPTYGVVGSSTSSYTSYRRLFVLEMFDKISNQKIYESKVISEGSSSQILSVIDEMIESLFIDFPGENGKSRKEKVEFKE